MLGVADFAQDPVLERHRRDEILDRASHAILDSRLLFDPDPTNTGTEANLELC